MSRVICRSNANVPVHWVGVKVHVACDVVVDPGRIPDHSVGVDPERCWLDLESGAAKGLGLVDKQVRHPEPLDVSSVDGDEVTAALGAAGQSGVATVHPYRRLQGDVLSLLVHLENVPQVQ